MRIFRISILTLLLVSCFKSFSGAQASQPAAWKSGLELSEDIFTKASFGQCHAATIAETPAGLIASWFGGEREGASDVAIYTSRKLDGKWTAPVEVANGVINDTLRYPAWNPVLFQVPAGELLLFYKTGPNVPEWKGFVLRSNDHGKSWSALEALPKGFYGPVKNKPVLLEGDRLLLPSSDEKPVDIWNVHFEVTDTKLENWRKIGPINDGKAFNIIQPSILTYPDGRLQMLCRSQQRRIVESWSTDDGQTWSAPARTALPNNNSGTDAVTLQDGRQLVVYNHSIPADTQKRGKSLRTPLNVSVSRDGKKWEAAVILEDEPMGPFAYPSVIQSTDGKVHIVYTWKRKTIRHVVLDPSKFKPVPFESTAWPVVPGYKAPVQSNDTPVY